MTLTNHPQALELAACDRSHISCTAGVRIMRDTTCRSVGIAQCGADLKPNLTHGTGGLMQRTGGGHGGAAEHPALDGPLRGAGGQQLGQIRRRHPRHERHGERGQPASGAAVRRAAAG